MSYILFFSFRRESSFGPEKTENESVSETMNERESVSERRGSVPKRRGSVQTSVPKRKDSVQRRQLNASKAE